MTRIQKKPAATGKKQIANAAAKKVAVKKTATKSSTKVATKVATKRTGKIVKQPNAQATMNPGEQVDSIVAWLKKTGTKATRDGMARYSLPSDKAFGVPVGVMLKEAKRIGRNHDVAMALWDTGWFEARMMATYLGEPERMTSSQMDKWCNESDNWGIADTACWHVFERSPYVWEKISKWSAQRGEYQKRTGLALLATIALHDKTTADAPFAKLLPMVEQNAADERNFVFKAANWALRSIGLRSDALRKKCLQVAERLAQSEAAGARWAGKDALRKLAKPAKLRAG